MKADNVETTSSPAVKHVVIVGGGSAGWMAAAWLQKALADEVRITQIESPRVGTIGVGEGTVPVIREFIEFLELQDSDWLEHCNATFKLGIRFNDWLEKGKWWWHPFFFKHPKFPEKQIVDSWLALRQQGLELFQDNETLKQACMSWQVAKENRCPAFLASHGSYESWDSDHAYHFDAALFGKYLKDKVAVPGGVTAISDHVTGVEVKDGLITAIQTENNGPIEADFFLDCTGFRRLLISKISDADFESYQDELPCDRAVTIAVPYEDKQRELRSYTVSTALSAGWVWQISLFHRIGMGYVYSSSHISDEEAEQELREFAGAERVKDIAVRHIQFEAGRLKRPFVGNCVATGLSEGFVEPLEATALGVTQKHISLIATILKEGKFADDPRVADKYNHEVCGIYDEIKSFLVSHYCLTRRRDTQFWRDVSQLKSPLHEVQKQGLPSIPREMIGAGVFSTQSWLCLANGLDSLPTPPESKVPTPTLSFQELGQAQQSQQRVLPGFLFQNFYLNHIRAQSAAHSESQSS